MLRVVKGGFAPADGYTAERLRGRLKVGDIVAATISKPRNPGFHRLAHALGKLLADNLDAFEGMEAHGVLKRLQIEGNIACDAIAVVFPGVGPCEYRIPQSLSFASMDETAFREVFDAMVMYVVRKYWPTMTPDQIEKMAEMVSG